MEKKENQNYPLSSRILFDLVLSGIGSLAAILLMRWVSEPIPGFSVLVAIWVVSALVFTLIGLFLSGTTRVVVRYTSIRGFSCLARALLIKETGLALLLLFGVIKLPSVTLAVVAVLSDILFSAVALVFPRLLVRSIRREEREIHAATGRTNALVVGTGDESVALADASDASGRYNVIGFLSGDPALAGKVVGYRTVYAAVTAEELEALQWRLGGIDCILFPKGSGHDGRPGPGAASGEDQIPNNDAMSAFGHAVKRSFDIVLSGILLLVFLPLGLICALAVHLEDGGPAIYRQERLGRGRKPFNILDAEAAGSPALYSGDDDPRLTRVGKFLRQHHLDELPQLWNVFRGDMSFIGYRPEREYYINQISAVNPRYRYLFQIRPGVTSYATLYNGYTDTLEKMLTRLDFDLYYLRNHSLWFDARLLALTFLRIVGGKKF